MHDERLSLYVCREYNQEEVSSTLWNYSHKHYGRGHKNNSMAFTRKDLLAIVKSVQHFYKYLRDKEFLIRTDHADLSWLLGL